MSKRSRVQERKQKIQERTNAFLVEWGVIEAPKKHLTKRERKEIRHNSQIINGVIEGVTHTPTLIKKVFKRRDKIFVEQAVANMKVEMATTISTQDDD